MPADTSPPPDGGDDRRESGAGRNAATPSTREVAPGEAEPAPATLGQVAGAVFWSFFGVRRGALMRRDAVTLRPAQVIVIGVVAAALFVVSLLVLVRFIIRIAGPA